MKLSLGPVCTFHNGLSTFVKCCGAFAAEITIIQSFYGVAWLFFERLAQLICLKWIREILCLLNSAFLNFVEEYFARHLIGTADLSIVLFSLLELFLHKTLYQSRMLQLTFNESMEA